jgi:hypothetical protein
MYVDIHVHGRNNFIFSISLLASIVILRVNVELFYKITSGVIWSKIENANQLPEKMK